MSLINPQDRVVHVVISHNVDAASGLHFDRVQFVSTTRNCSNCDSDGARDPEWVASMEQLGRCMNACNAADFEDPDLQWCTDHQTPAEFEAGIHRPSVPVRCAESN